MAINRFQSVLIVYDSGAQGSSCAHLAQSWHMRLHAIDVSDWCLGLCTGDVVLPHCVALLINEHESLTYEYTLAMRWRRQNVSERYAHEIRKAEAAGLTKAISLGFQAQRLPDHQEASSRYCRIGRFGNRSPQ